MKLRCTVIKSFQHLPVGAKVTLMQDAYNRRLALGQVSEGVPVDPVTVDPSLLEDDGIHADNVSKYTASEDADDPPEKKPEVAASNKRKSFFKKKQLRHAYIRNTLSGHI